MTEQEIRDIAKQAMREVVSAKNTDDRMDELEGRVDKIGNALNEINEKLDGKKAEGENAAFEGKETEKEEKEEKEAEEGAAVENAKPSQDMVKAFATAFNVDFGGKTPSFATLATFAGVKETDPVARVAAVNAKFKEMQNATPATGSASGSVMEVF
jgi:chromatin remodeling complex protein RSC6